MAAKGTAMESDLTRAQHYRQLAETMRKSAREERAAKRQRDFLDLASQYEHMADKLVARLKPMGNTA